MPKFGKISYFEQKSFAFAAGEIYNELPSDVGSKTAFTSYLNNHFS